MLIKRLDETIIGESSDCSKVFNSKCPLSCNSYLLNLA